MSPRWSNTTKYIVLILILVAVFSFIYFARPLIGPLIISALLAFVLNPLAGWIFARTRLRWETAVLIVYLLVLTLLIAIPSLIAPSLIRQVLRLSVDLLAIEQQLEAFLRQPILIGNLTISPPIQFTQNIEEVLQNFIGQASSGAFNLLGGMTSNLAWALVILIATYYLLKDSARLTAWIVRLAPTGYQHDFERLLREMNRVWGAFLRGQIILALVIGILTSVAMAAVGLRGAVGVGILAGVLDVIPSLGPLVAGIVAVLVGLIFGSSFLPISNILFALIVGAIFLVIQQIENIWLRPQIMGQTLQLHPALIFIGVVGALALTGVLGALVVIPLMASLGILGHYVRAKLLDETPWPDAMPVIETELTESDPAPAQVEVNS